ncbi:MAG: L,D-transpeptidase family protein [Candidatus Berkelbacteria bacterium]|nr:L,D-transpeptidase family protein [Candidatus Berkelbacteria bacterium]
MTHKTSKVIFVVLVFVAFFVLAAAVLLVSYQKVYANKIYRNIRYADINLSGQSLGNAEVILSSHFQQILKKEITIKTANKEVKVALADTGIAFDPKQIAETSYRIGRADDFLNNLISSGKTVIKTYDISAQPIIDPDKYKQFLNVAIAQLNIQPADASLKIENGEIKLTDAVVGQVVQVDDLANEIIAAVNNNQNTINVTTKEVQPAVANESFAAAQAQAQTYLSENITLTYNNKTYTPSKTDIGTWIEFANKDGVISAGLNNDNITAYLSTVAQNFEVKRVDQKVDANTGAEISAGKQGVYLNKTQAVAELTRQMALGAAVVKVALATTTEDPKVLKVNNSDNVETGRFEGKYIDVNLSTQRLCRLEGQTVISCYTISSGKASTPTVQGTFAIQNKSPRAWSAAHGLWMPWWEGFDGPYGIHELPEWPNGYKEGEAHLGTPVSHGCVRLGIGAAEEVYNWTEIGTPVYIHT